MGTTEDGTVAAFDRATGAMRWKVDFPGVDRDRPADRRVGRNRGRSPGTSDGGRRTGPGPRPRDRRHPVGRVHLEKLAAPVVHAGLVVLSEGDNHSHARIRALDAATGAARWETAVPKSFEWETEPAAEGDDYVTVDHFGTVTAVDLRSGEIRWRHSDDWALIDTQILLTGRSVAFHDFARRRGGARPVDGRRPVGDPAGGRRRSTPRTDGDRRRRRRGLARSPVRGPAGALRPGRAARPRTGGRPRGFDPGAAGGHRYNGCRPDPPDGAPPCRHPGSRTPASSEVVPRTRGAGGRRTQPEERKPHPWLSRRHHEAAAGGRSPFRPPDAPLEPEDAPVHLR